MELQVKVTLTPNRASGKLAFLSILALRAQALKEGMGFYLELANLAAVRMVLLWISTVSFRWRA